MMLRSTLFPAIMLLLPACQPPQETVTARSDATPSETRVDQMPGRPAGSAAKVESPIIGAWHLRPNGVINLDIKSNGTFVWNSDSCDSGDAGEGRWRPNPSGGIDLELEDDSGWPALGNDPFEKQTLRVTQQGEEITIANTVPDRQEHRPGASPPPRFPQIWAKGTVCAQCGDRSIHAVPCNEPVTTRVKAHH
jgi:hypothetical protein